MMRKYETIFVMHPSFEDEAVKAAIDKFKGVIENGGGTVDNVDVWGKRKLAYEIAKVNEGFYTLINFTASPELPRELDRIFRITDGVIRHIIVKEEK
jgi:small subunit ribosomal protein S6